MLIDQVIYTNQTLLYQKTGKEHHVKKTQLLETRKCKNRIVRAVVRLKNTFIQSH